MFMCETPLHCPSTSNESNIQDVCAVLKHLQKTQGKSDAEQYKHVFVWVILFIRSLLVQKKGTF